MLHMDQTNRYSWGKILIHINKIVNFPFYGNLFVRISLPPWQICTRRIMDQRLDFNQFFYIPVSNNFFTLKLEVINLSSDGWLREHYSEQILATYQIRIPDINKAPFAPDGSLSLPINILGLDYKKVGLQPNPLPPIKDEFGKISNVLRQPLIQIKVIDMTRSDACIVYNPNRDIMEDRKYLSDYTVKQMNTVLTRSKLFFALTDSIIQADTFLFYFYYPRFSYVIWIFMHLFIYYFDPAYLLSYLVFGLMFQVAQYSAWWEQQITPIVDHLFFNIRHLHESLKTGNNLLTFDQISYIKCIKYLIVKEDDEEKDEELLQMKSNYSLKEKGMLDKYRDAKKGTVVVVQCIEVICDFAEKARNLVQWEDTMQTQLFLLLLFIIFLVVTFLPLKFILTLSTAYKFYKGRGWQKKRIRNNEEVCRLELLNFLKTNNLSRVILNFEHTWISQIKSAKRIPKKEFEQKLVEYFQSQVKVYLPSNILEICETP